MIGRHEAPGGGGTDDCLGSGPQPQGAVLGDRMEEKINVLIVDDAAFMRKAIADVLGQDPQIEIVGTARNGLEGLQAIRELQPDVITLDIDMPVMDGLTGIRHIMIESPVPIVVLSSLFTDGAITFDALRLGVVDFIPKPSGAVSTDIEKSQRQLIDRIKIASSVNLQNIRRVRLQNWDLSDRFAARYGYTQLDYLLALGTTLSGPNTVIRLLSNLPPRLPAAVVVVQEISPKIIKAFAEQFDASVPWRVRVGEDDMPLEQGTCYLSSYERPLRIHADGDGNVCLKQAANGAMPLDLLFATAADVFHRNTVGVLLTGIGEDGARGLAHIRENEGVTLAQDTQCCVYPNLTHHAIQQGAVDIVLDELKLPEAIASIMA
jgi:two-component system chemotaxis response regulator CheB